ncbi:hypothetical protein U9M48_008097 [Paspalum notatum var. saurae]|uniref:Uncharacterized protein n=1 Tax=Paspalum notatum var. saurae TaxID=547442 RepID=A0AAQ3SNY4_PASNO
MEDPGWTPRRQHRNGGFWLRAEIEMDRGSAIPRGPGFGFAAAVREPLVKLRRPQYDFERWDWDYFAWPHDRLDGKKHVQALSWAPGSTLEINGSGRNFDQNPMADHIPLNFHTNLEMRDSDPEATFDADRKASESFLNQSTLQLESYEMYQNEQEHHAAAWPRDHLDANLETRDSVPEAALEADQKASESSEMCHRTQEQQAAASLHCHLDANLGATPQTDQKTKERSMRRLKRCDRKTKEQHKEKENKDAVVLRTPMPANKKAVGPRSARRRRVFAEVNRILDDGGARQDPWVVSQARTHHLVATAVPFQAW